MGKIDPQGYVSVIGMSSFQPLLSLVEVLESREANEPNVVQASAWENGYSCSIVVLSVLLLESAINRTHYLRERQGKFQAVEYFTGLVSDPAISPPDPDLAVHVAEVFALRDAVVHNHLWESKIFEDDDFSLKFAARPRLIPGYGRSRMPEVKNYAGRSHCLKLNLIPSKIWRREAYIVLKTVGRALKKLESMDRNYFYFSFRSFKFRGRNMRFLDVLDEITVLGSEDRKALLNSLDLVEKSLPEDRELAGYSKARMIDLINQGRGEVMKRKSNQLFVLQTIAYAISADHNLRLAYQALKAALAQVGVSCCDDD